MKRVKCKSGLEGYQCRLQESYTTFDEWDSACNIYNLHLRLGFKSIAGAWRVNPLIRGSITPSDFCRVKESVKKKAKYRKLFLVEPHMINVSLW